MRRTSPPDSRGISRCDLACSRCAGRRDGARRAERRNVYHQALLRYIGCNADTHLLAAAFGDEIALRRDLPASTWATSPNSPRSSSAPSRGSSPARRPRSWPRRSSRAWPRRCRSASRSSSGHCEVAQRIAERIGLSERDPRESRPALRALGRQGTAARTKGRCGQAAGPAGDAGAGRDRAHEAHGFEAMVAMIAKRGGGAYEPELADLFLARCRDACSTGLDGAVDRETILALEPAAACDARRGRRARRPISRSPT